VAIVKPEDYNKLIGLAIGRINHQIKSINQRYKIAGGNVLAGIAWRNGEEYISERWTNPAILV
jgi:hypothetical protein